MRAQRRFHKSNLPHTERTNGTSGYIYVVKFSDDIELYKIGKCGDFHKRLSGLMTSNPFIKPILFQRVKNSRSCELSLHKRFRSKRESGEWFRLTMENLAYVRRFLDSNCPANFQAGGADFTEQV